MWWVCWLGACKRVVSAAASPPTGSPPQYSPALLWVTTGFGMGPGGARTLSATDTTLSPAHSTPVNSFKMEWVCCCVGVRCSLVFGSNVCTSQPHACADDAGVVGGCLCRVEWGGDPPSAMSTGRLRSVASRPPPASQPGRLPGAFLLTDGETRLAVGFPLRCFQRFAHPNVATQRCRLPDNWITSGSSTPVLSY